MNIKLIFISNNRVLNHFHIFSAIDNGAHNVVDAKIIRKNRLCVIIITILIVRWVIIV